MESGAFFIVHSSLNKYVRLGQIGDPYAYIHVKGVRKNIITFKWRLY